VPGAVVSAAAVTGGMGNITAGAMNLTQAMSTGSGGTPAARGEASFASEAKLAKHVAKHSGEWPGGISEAEYLSRARQLLKANPGGDILGHVRANGDILRYNVATNEFASQTAEGTIRTFFRPTEGMAYWLMQVGP
jgi:pyocin large subunit-like protein